MTTLRETTGWSRLYTSGLLLEARSGTSAAAAWLARMCAGMRVGSPGT